MAIRSNGYYNNPAFAQAAANLSSLFAPPSGSDAAGWANASAKQAEANRLGIYFDQSQDPNVDLDQLSRTGLGVGAFDFRGSKYGVDQADATQRYGYDQTFNASRLNNADNNAAALERQFLEPVTVAQGATTYVPKRAAEVSGLAEILEGSRAPLSETQLAARERQRLIEAGVITDDMLADDFVGQRTPVQTVDAQGRPAFSSPGAAARSGAEAFVPDRSPGTVRMYRTKDGQVGRTVDGMTDMVTKLPVPADALVGSISDTSESFGTSELSKARENILGRRAGLTSMIDQVAAIDEQLAGANADQAVGVIGSGARIFNDLATQASAAFRAAGVAAPEELRDVQRYQDTFRALGIQNAELQSGLLDLAYATATAREPGKLTDADVQRAMQTIGANLQDPKAMRQVLRGAVKRARMDYDAQERTYFDAFGDNLNLGRAQFRDIAPLDGATPAGGPAATGQPTAEELWERGPDGRLRRVAQ